MGIFTKRVENIADKTADITLMTPQQMLTEVLKKASGTKYGRVTKYNMFYSIYGFIGALEGYGTSTICANVAYALSKTGMPICVIDANMMHPQQDLLLKTNALKTDIPVNDRLDWFDMPYHDNESVLHVSSYASNISVLSFYGKDRNITDLLATKDSDALVDLAFAQLQSKFDVILIDFSHEPSAVNAALLHRVQKIYQIWSDSPQFMDNIDNLMRNLGVLSVPYDKMTTVIYSMISNRTIGSMDSLLDQYHCKKLTEIPISEEINMVGAMNKLLFQYESKNPDVIQFTRAVCDVVSNILEFKDDELGSTSVKSKDIEAGKVDGTATKKLKEKADYRPDIITDLENADKSLEEFMFEGDEIDVTTPVKDKKSVENTLAKADKPEGSTLAKPDKSEGKAVEKLVKNTKDKGAKK